MTAMPNSAVHMTVDENRDGAAFAVSVIEGHSQVFHSHTIRLVCVMVLVKPLKNDA